MPLAEQRGGAERMLLHLLQESQGRSVRFHPAFLENGTMAREVTTMGYPVRVFPAGHLREAGHYLGTVAAMARWLRRERLDGVISWMAKAHLYAAPAALIAGRGKRAVWFQHAVAVPGGASGMDRLVGALPSREIWCPSRHTATAQRLAAPRRAVRVVYPSVDLEDFDPKRLPAPAQARANLGVPADGPLVGMVTRLERWKGCDTFVDACPHILARIPTARFVIVGGGHFAALGYAEELRCKATRLGIGDRLQLVGHRTDVSSCMQALDALVCASYCEPFGMTVIEAMALGKPVIAAASGGPLETICDGETGRLFTVADPVALADAVVSTMLLPDRGAALGLRAQKETAVRFGARRLAEEVEAAVLELFA